MRDPLGWALSCEIAACCIARAKGPHVCRPSSVFWHAHVAPENGFDYISPLRRRNSARFWYSACRGRCPHRPAPWRVISALEFTHLHPRPVGVRSLLRNVLPCSQGPLREGAVSGADWGRMRDRKGSNSRPHGFAVPPPSEREALRDEKIEKIQKTCHKMALWNVI